MGVGRLGPWVGMVGTGGWDNVRAGGSAVWSVAVGVFKQQEGPAGCSDSCNEVREPAGEDA